MGGEGRGGGGVVGGCVLLRRGWGVGCSIVSGWGDDWVGLEGGFVGGET